MTKVLFVGAHADDVEIGAGAWIHRLVKNGNIDPYVLAFSGHRGVEANYSPQIETEFRESMACLGVTHGVLHDYEACTGQMQSSRAKIYALLDEFRKKTKPSMVVTHPIWDSNQDHTLIAAEVLRVFKKSATILYWEFPTNEVHAMAPNVFIEVEKEDVMAKIDALMCYRSQAGQATHSYMLPTVVMAQAVFRGSLIDRPHAEAFYSVRSVSLIEH